MDKKALFLSIKLFLFSIILILLGILFNSLSRSLSKNSGMEVISATDLYPIIVIDAGHGGEDGGAIGINKCLEKDINLEISLSLYELLRASDIPVVLTRDSDIMLYDSAKTGKKKAQDLKNRLLIAEEYENSILVSIHMNSYPSPAYSGTQVYYSPNHEKSEILARTIQTTVTQTLQPENKREIKVATSTIYLLHNIKRPAVLIECGFISNHKEAELLCSDNYRHKMATSIYVSILKYLSENKDQDNEGQQNSFHMQ